MLDICLNPFACFRFSPLDLSLLVSDCSAAIHVNVQNYQPTVWNFADPTGDTDSGSAGISRNMTTLADVMKRGGDKTHFAGKWDVGMAHRDMTPRARGYDTSLFYFHHE